MSRYLSLSFLERLRISSSMSPLRRRTLSTRWNERLPRVHAPTRLNHGYSDRMAAAGSTIAARCAGPKHATSVMATNVTHTRA